MDTNVTIYSVEISNGSIIIECEGDVVVNLEYDNHESDDDFNRSFPFVLKAKLEFNQEKLEMVDLYEFCADTTAIYA